MNDEVNQLYDGIQALREGQTQPTAPGEAVPDAAPAWYTSEEMHHWLIRHHYSTAIADELCAQYANNLQKAFEKGYEIGRRG